ncbi:hypothetical protein BDR04DRAFT_201975 [Suillus decipiens]|nr:hypothetical protein BDR04DRAFT_201975 [Suillus decipiens]
MGQCFNEQYPRPALDPVWLRDCCSWIASSYALSPNDLTQLSYHIIFFIPASQALPCQTLASHRIFIPSKGLVL